MWQCALTLGRPLWNTMSVLRGQRETVQRVPTLPGVLGLHCSVPFSDAAGRCLSTATQPSCVEPHSPLVATEHTECLCYLCPSVERALWRERKEMVLRFFWSSICCFCHFCTIETRCTPWETSTGVTCLKASPHPAEQKRGCCASALHWRSGCVWLQGFLCEMVL